MTVATRPGLKVTIEAARTSCPDLTDWRASIERGGVREIHTTIPVPGQILGNRFTMAWIAVSDRLSPNEPCTSTSRRIDGGARAREPFTDLARDTIAGAVGNALHRAGGFTTVWTALFRATHLTDAHLQLTEAAVNHRALAVHIERCAVLADCLTDPAFADELRVRPIRTGVRTLIRDPFTGRTDEPSASIFNSDGQQVGWLTSSGTPVAYEGHPR
jgi:hypothetical protein